MLVVEVTKTYKCGKIESQTHNFKTDKEAFTFLESLEKNKMQDVYNSMNLGIYKRPLKYTGKPITKKQRETNGLIKKISENINYTLNIKIWQ